MLYAWMSTQNGPDKQTVAEFKAREFKVGEAGQLDLSNVQQLDRDQVNAACPRLEEVQDRTNAGVAAVRNSEQSLTPQQFGTAVHLNLKDQIKALDDLSFVPEKSLLKTQEEAGYGAPGSIRMDVLERADSKTACAYDIKTGKSDLSARRMGEIAINVAKNFEGIERIIVTQVRPTK
jgi:hypothetical protein